MNRRDFLKFLGLGLLSASGCAPVLTPLSLDELKDSGHKFSTVDSINLCYNQTGQGRDIVAIHGLAGTKETFSPLSKCLPEFRLTTFDLKGHGNSDKPEKGYSLTELATETKEFTEILGIKKPYFIGHSLGASILAYLKLQSQNLAEKGIYLSGYIPQISEPNPIKLEGMLSDINLYLMNPFLLEMSLENLCFSNHPSEIKEQAEYRYPFLKTHEGWSSVQKTFEAAEVDLRKFSVEQFREVSKGNLCVHGRNDPLMKLVKDPEQKFKELYPDSRLIILEKCGHLSTIEKPEELAGIVREYFGS